MHTSSPRTSIFASTCALLLALGFAPQAQAQFQVGYNFDANLNAIVTGADAPLVTATAFDLNGNGFRSNGAVVLSGANSPHDAASALGGTAYWEFTLSAAEQGTLLSLDSFTFNIGVSGSGTGMRSYFIVQSSIDGFGTGKQTLDLSPNTIYTSGDVLYESATVSLTSEFRSLQTVTFRLYTYTESTAANKYSRLDNIVVSGASIPESSSSALALGVLALVAFVWHRRRKHA